MVRLRTRATDRECRGSIRYGGSTTQVMHELRGLVVNDGLGVGRECVQEAVGNLEVVLGRTAVAVEVGGSKFPTLLNGGASRFVQEINDDIGFSVYEVGVHSEGPAVGLRTGAELAAQVADLGIREVNLRLERGNSLFVLLHAIGGRVIDELVRIEGTRSARKDGLCGYGLRLGRNAGVCQCLGKGLCHALDVEGWSWLLCSLLVGLILVSHSLSSCTNDGGKK